MGLWTHWNCSYLLTYECNKYQKLILKLFKLYCFWLIQEANNESLTEREKNTTIKKQCECRRNTRDNQYLCKFKECINIKWKYHSLMRDTKLYWKRKLLNEEMKMANGRQIYWWFKH